jgi:hypothetical protein
MAGELQGAERLPYPSELDLRAFFDPNDKSHPLSNTMMASTTL